MRISILFLLYFVSILFYGHFIKLISCIYFNYGPQITEHNEGDSIGGELNTNETHESTDESKRMPDYPNPYGRKK